MSAEYSHSEGFCPSCGRSLAVGSSNVVQGWWTIADATLKDLLRRVADGEDPEMVYMEHFANATHGSLREWLDRNEIK